MQTLPAVIGNRGVARIYNRNLPKYFTADEAHLILSDYLKGQDYDSYFLSLFLWNTGTRISEALSVTVADIDLIGKAVRIVTLKRKGHIRVLPIQNGFIGELALWINVKGLKRGDRLFQISRKTAYNYVQYACEVAGITDERAHPHTWRHAFAVNCIIQGVPVTVLREWLGHRDITKTLIYTQIVGQDTRAFMEGVRF